MSVMDRLFDRVKKLERENRALELKIKNAELRKKLKKMEAEE